MSSPTRLALGVGAFGGIVAGVATGMIAGLVLDGDRGRAVAGYALGVMPLAAFVGASAAGWWSRSRAASPAGQLAGALFAASTAVVVSLGLGALRFRVAGATGVVSLRALWYTAEFLMVIGLIPAVAALGAASRRRWADSSTLARSIAPVVIGIAAALLAGPVAIGVASLAGLATPVTVAVVALGLIVALRLRVP